jgi:hypothetical protein
MRVLFRVAASLLIAVPLFVVLVILLALAPKGRASVSQEGGTSSSLDKEPSAGSARRAPGAVVEVSR